MEDNKDIKDKIEDWGEELKNVKVPEWLLQYIKSQQKPDETISETLARLLGVIPTIDRCLAFADEIVRERAKEVRTLIEQIIGPFRIKFRKTKIEGYEIYTYVSEETNHPIVAMIFAESSLMVAYRDHRDEWSIREGCIITSHLSEEDYIRRRDEWIKKYVEGSYRRWGVKENQWEKIH